MGSSSYEPCPEPVWDGSTNYGTFTVHSPWDIEYRVEASVEAGGTNDQIQICDQGFSVTVPAGKKMVFGWALECVVETENPGFDVTQYIIDSAIQASLGSTASGGGTATETKTASGTTVLTAGLHDIAVYFSTGDPLYHTAAVGYRFQITSCYIAPA